MLRFAVYDGGEPAGARPLPHAHLVGKDDLAVAAQIALEAGVIECRKSSSEEAALAIQFDAGEPGVLTLRTTLLPERPEPYLLELELARYRIMLFLNKIEEWSLSSLADDHPAMAAFEEARSLFTQALVLPHDPARAAERADLARRSLARAIEASETLALLQADRQLKHRLTPDEDARPIPLPRIGAVVHTSQFSEPLQRVVATHFDFVVSPMRWREIEREEGRFTFVKTDRWIEWAVRSGKVSIVGGPVLDFTHAATPPWLRVWEHDYDTLREFAYEHAKRVVTRYRRTVSRWNVISGVNLRDGFSFTIDQMLELTRLAVLLVRKLHPAAKVVVEFAQPFGEHAADDSDSVSPLLYAELLLEAGVSVDAFGLRLQMGDGRPGRSARDLMQLSAVLDMFAGFERPLDVTALGAPSAPASADGASAPGEWRGAWSPDLQAEWLTHALTVAASKPFVRSVAWQALFDADDDAEMPAGGLITAEGRAKPALRRIGELRAAVRRRVLPSEALADRSPEAAGAPRAEAP